MIFLSSIFISRSVDAPKVLDPSYPIMPDRLFILTPRYANVKSTPRPLKSFLRPHIHYFQWSIHQLNHMSWFQCFGVYIVNIVGVEDAGFRAIENGLFARRIGKAKAPPTDI
jgi:hypothetical protein